jgi:hypothetical protein
MWLTLQQQIVMCSHYVELCLQGQGYWRKKNPQEHVPTFTIFLQVIVLSINIFLVLFYPGFSGTSLLFFKPFLRVSLLGRGNPSLEPDREDEPKNKTTLHTTGRDR